MKKKITLHDIERAKDLSTTLRTGSLKFSDLHKEDQKILERVQMALASRLPSPSKLNAVSVIDSNSAQKIYNYMEYYEWL